jgi:hypothetical protein
MADYLGAANGPVVFFDKDQEYKLEGRTHGVFSHLMRHMGDIGMKEHHPYVLEHFEKAITRGLSENYDMLYYDGTGRYPIDENFLYSVKTGTLIKIARITLDRISDDVLLGKEITDVEKEFISKSRRLIKIYREMVQDIIDDHQFIAVSKKDPKKLRTEVILVPHMVVKSAEETRKVALIRQWEILKKILDNFPTS